MAELLALLKPLVAEFGWSVALAGGMIGGLGFLVVFLNRRAERSEAHCADVQERSLVLHTKTLQVFERNEAQGDRVLAVLDRVGENVRAAEEASHRNASLILQALMGRRPGDPT